MIRTRQDLGRLDRVRNQGPLVLVPTMGDLHAGHLSLVELGSRLGPVVVSIFVNPTQFGPQEDYDSYPGDLERDLAALAALDVAAVFAPCVAEVYRDLDGVQIEPGPRGRCLCGASRPGHFAGVLTVVAKLFHLVRPEIAVFGRKDAQQCLVIEEMVRDLDFPVRLIDGPTVRQGQGLALSSRNRYLTAEERERARCLSHSLAMARRAIVTGERDAGAVAKLLRSFLAPVDTVEYAEVRAVPELTPLSSISGLVLLAVAVRIGRSRLIDNQVLRVSEAEVVDAGLLPAEELQ